MKAGHAAKNGFTLIELMVVVIIIAALAGMVLPRVLPASEEAKKKIALGDMAGISMAVNMYRLHTGGYPASLAVLLEPSPNYNNEPFLDSPPTDPWGEAYQYAYPGKQSSYGFDVFSMGPDRQAGNADDVWRRKPGN